jgi:thioredoxin-related protein
MRALFVFSVACLFFVSADVPASRAGVEPGARPASMELIVFEHPDCAYCRIFRQIIAPSYQSSPRAPQAPLRYVDIAKSDIGGLHLSESIDTLPTAVLMKDGREEGRIAGYWGRDSFLRMLAHIMSTVD